MKLNEDEYACEIRDISEISFFKRCSKSGLGAENSPLSLASQDSSGGSGSKYHQHAQQHASSPYDPFQSK